jgi:hypothetical protein
VLGPTLTGITPTQGHGAGVTLGIPAVNVTIAGTGVTGATGINFPPVVAGTLGGGITVGKIVVSNDGATLTATLTIANGAAQTLRDVWVVTPIGITPITASATFTVQRQLVQAGLPQWGVLPIRIMGIQ